MKTLTDEEKFEIEVLYVLIKIKEEFHYPQPEEEEVEYTIYILNHRIPSDMPFLIRERKILYWLNKTKVLKIIEHPLGGKGPLISKLPDQKTIKVIITYQLKVSLFHFKEYYERYQSKCERKMKKLLEQKSYQNKNKMIDQIDEIIKTKKIRGKEKKLLLILSSFQKKEINELKKDKVINTKDLKHVKAELQEKFKDTNFRIKTILGYGTEPSYYQLEYLPGN